MIKATLIGFACFILFLAVHLVVFRAFTLKERFRAIKYIFFLMVPVYVALYLWCPSTYVLVESAGTGAGGAAVGPSAYRATVALNFLAGLMFYVFLFLGYCQFYFIVDRSISVRIMIELERAPGKKLDYDGILSVYSFDEILRRRLTHMLEGNYIVKDAEGRYSNTGKGRKEAALFAFLKSLLNIGPGG